MAFTSLTTTQVAPGQPVTGTLMGLIKTDLDDHQARLTTLEGGGSTVYAPMVFGVFGPYSVQGATSDLLRETINFNLQVIGITLISQYPGTAGTLQITLEYLRPTVSTTTWNALFTTPPSLSSLTNNSVTSSVVLNVPNCALQAGDIIRLNTTSVQTGARGFLVRVDYTKS